jgi:oxygen-dependent protoporphyrinogen oxidase
VLRVFFGGYAHESDASLDDAALIRLARYELRGILGIGAEPLKSKVFRFPSASPQPVIGHSERMKSMRERTSAHRGLFVAGSAIDGTGIPDCIRQATGIAESLARASAPQHSKASREPRS